MKLKSLVIYCRSQGTFSNCLTGCCSVTPLLSKPANIFLFSPGPYPHIQIADFGVARSRAYEKVFDVQGTIAYLPPEAILALRDKTLGYFGLPADCWSAGVILFLMLS